MWRGSSDVNDKDAVASINVYAVFIVRYVLLHMRVCSAQATNGRGAAEPAGLSQVAAVVARREQTCLCLIVPAAAPNCGLDTHRGQARRD